MRCRKRQPAFTRGRDNMCPRPGSPASREASLLPTPLRVSFFRSLLPSRPALPCGGQGYSQFTPFSSQKPCSGLEAGIPCETEARKLALPLLYHGSCPAARQRGILDGVQRRTGRENHAGPQGLCPVGGLPRAVPRLQRPVVGLLRQLAGRGASGEGRIPGRSACLRGGLE